MSRRLLAALLVFGTARGAAADMTEGAVPGEQLKAIVPKKLAGFAPSHELDYPWAYGAAYTLPDGYANLDIQNTFHRGTKNTSIEDRNASNKKLCPKKEKVTGYTACVDVQADGHTAIRWYLPDRLTVRIASPSEKLTRKMAADLPLAKLAKLSAAK